MDREASCPAESIQEIYVEIDRLYRPIETTISLSNYVTIEMLFLINNYIYRQTCQFLSCDADQFLDPLIDISNSMSTFFHSFQPFHDLTSITSRP